MVAGHAVACCHVMNRGWSGPFAPGKRAVMLVSRCDPEVRRSARVFSPSWAGNVTAWLIAGVVFAAALSAPSLGVPALSAVPWRCR